jgi:hypothetical protein
LAKKGSDGAAVAVYFLALTIPSAYHMDILENSAEDFLKTLA